ncbi:hypothetical protein NSU_0160 [Novosphingobium pentaromativorans US6-1]|uniref:Uncharacterized protein n=1 Tax=Novosphingobium pentaromativorans US6-1 TaxID=1088721 RepID=G6E739_9SPHN|nr:hypothetical protein NSU_0160 [Novosphingobium pentaromativorans US6-1]
MIAALVVAALPACSYPQSALAGDSAQAVEKHYSTSETEIGVLLDNPEAKAVLDKHMPGFTANPQVSMARGLTLAGIQQYSPDTVTDEVLAEIDADLAKIPVK